MRDRLARIASHVGAFACGAVVATALVAEAVPERSSNRERYAALDTFAEALAHISSSYVDEVDERRLLHAAVRGMVDDLDPHSSFLPPRRYQRLRQDTEGEFGGVGLRLDEPPAGATPAWPVVADVVDGSPADGAGIRAGDRVVAIDSRSTLGRTRRNARAWHSVLRGRVGTPVSVRLHRVGWDEPRTVQLARARVVVPTVERALMPGDIGYVRVSRFQDATTSDVEAALERLRAESGGPIRALLLDLRGNPGGLLDQAVGVADLFLEAGTIVTVSGRRGTLEEHHAGAGGAWRRFPMWVLVDQASASAAEIVAGALQDHGRAEVAGVPTYGKGSVQTFLDLEDGSGLKLTTARYLTPDGRSLEGDGIEPDVALDAVGAAPSGEGGPGRARTRARGSEVPEIAAGDLQLRIAHQMLRARLGSKKTEPD